MVRRGRSQVDAGSAIDDLKRLVQAVGDTFTPFYGPAMKISDADALRVAEPAGRIISRYAGMTQKVQELSDPMLLMGAIATVLFPRAVQVMTGRAAAAAPVPAPGEMVRETTVSQTVTEQVPREYVDPATINDHVWRMRNIA